MAAMPGRPMLLLPFVLLLLIEVSLAASPQQSSNAWFTDALKELSKHINRKPNHQPAKNVIIFIGDGCDITTNTAARIRKGQLSGAKGEEGYLAYEEFPYTGLSKTYNTDKQVPDSAGTANALFSGVKTRYSIIGLNEQVVFKNCSSMTNERKVDSILKLAEEAGMATGIVTTMRVTHATPASLYAHSPSRNWESDMRKEMEVSDAQKCKDIAQQLVDFQDSFQQQSLYNGNDEYESHGGQDVGIYSTGPWADLLTGVVEQNYIFHVMDHALCLSQSKQSQCTKHEARGGPKPAGSGARGLNSAVCLLLTASVYILVFCLL
ncbi:alkaline phosphatase, tissue-nonspecific isozyme [Nematostella vectensis]|uniref:alkaline phosphatase, tissue-nonspecific isozyme n=1 Tax=Nematostella vectensis TaxID=45351 RepID=UPI002076F3D6|nr:alkaline phosphatase, tissue-nonspecific isozyme [Nematostella vectensis]